MGPNGIEYYQRGDIEPFFSTALDVPIIPRHEVEEITYPVSMPYDYVLMGPNGSEYYFTGDMEPFLSTPIDVPIIEREDRPVEEPEQIPVQDARPVRAAAQKCKEIISDFFSTMALYGEDF